MNGMDMLYQIISHRVEASRTSSESSSPQDLLLVSDATTLPLEDTPGQREDATYGTTDMTMPTEIHPSWEQPVVEKLMASLEVMNFSRIFRVTLFSIKFGLTTSF